MLTRKKKHYTPPTKRERLVVIAISLTIVSVFLYLAMRDNSIADEELETISVTLRDAPRYYDYKIKNTTYRNIILTTREFEREFWITGMTYKATDHIAFEFNVLAGDTVLLRVKKSSLEHLDQHTFFNDYNGVYSLSKNGYNYIDLDRREKLEDNDSKWAYFFVFLGLVMLPYGFIKGKPQIGLDKAVAAVAVLVLIFLVFTKC